MEGTPFPLAALFLYARLFSLSFVNFGRHPVALINSILVMPSNRASRFALDLQGVQWGEAHTLAPLVVINTRHERRVNNLIFAKKVQKLKKIFGIGKIICGAEGGAPSKLCSTTMNFPYIRF